MPRYLRTSARAVCICLIGAAISGTDAAPETPEWVKTATRRAETQYAYLLGQNALDKTKLPKTATPAGKPIMAPPTEWTSGFFPGCLWQLYALTNDPVWKIQAENQTKKLAGQRHFNGNHDGGFMLGCSYGNQQRMAPNQETQATQAILRDAAAALSSRFIPEIRQIKAWNLPNYPVIIDTMMNLELLMWASKNGGCPRFADIARQHADETLADHFRPDGTAYHIMEHTFSVDNKLITTSKAGQGNSTRTPWARGQSWALYGFTMMFRETGDPRYLEKAKQLAGALMAHPNMPADKIPAWDYGITAGTYNRDASAAAIMASALLELAEHSRNDQFREFALQQLETLASPKYLAQPLTNAGFLLKHSIGNYPERKEIDVPLIYADYYFLEALNRMQTSLKTPEESPEK